MNMSVESLATNSRQSKSLASHVALVTGGSRGIGAAIATELAAHGATVAISYVEHNAEAEEVRRQLEAMGASVMTQHADVTNAGDMKAFVDRVVDEYGRLDILINNAGILRDRSFKNMSEDEWDDVLRTNLGGVFKACRAAAPHMISRGSGAIVNISSVVAQTGNFGQANYSAAKAGILGLTKTLALELARYGVRVNAVCPGFVDTAMWQSIPENVRDAILEKIPLRRVASTSDIAGAVRYLVEAPYVTGETLNVNGGLLMS